MTSGRRLAALLAAVAVLALPIRIGQASAATCSLAPTGGLVTETFGGRQYLVQVPVGLTGPAPLVLALHGAWQGARLMATHTNIAPYAAANGTIIVFPNGLPTFSGFDAALLWDFSQQSPDSQYLRALVGEIASRWCVEPRRVHALGHSNGALMSLRLACDAADLFASVAEYAGGPPEAFGSPCNPVRPISVGIFSSVFDFLSLYPFGIYTRDTWVRRNACPAAPFRESGPLLEATRHAPCAAGTEVVWRGYLFQSHNWPYGADRADIQNRMWKLFRDNPLPA